MSDILPIEIQPSGYIVFPVTLDPNALLAAALATIAADLPGWVPQEGQIELAVLEQNAQMAAESAQVAALVPPGIFQYLAQLYGISPEAGSPASADTTWTMVNANGYTVPAGTLVAYMTLGNTQVQFQTVADFTVPAGQTATSAGAVQIEATVVGSVNIGLPDSSTIVPVLHLAFVSSIVATGTTSGGSDPETLSAFLNRFANLLQLSTARPILPNDFAALAPNVAGVYRAMAIDLLNPGRTITGTITLNGTTTLQDTAGSFTVNDVGRSVTGTDIPGSTTISTFTDAHHVVMNNAASGSLTGGSVTLGDLDNVERCVTVAAVDIDGNALDNTIEGDLVTYLESMREINFLVFVIGPTVTEIDVTWSGVAQIGASQSTVQAAGNAAISAFLSKANWAAENVSFTATVTDGSDQLTDIVVPMDSRGNPAFTLATGMPVSGFGIQANTTITEISSDSSGLTLTISNTAQSTGTAILEVQLLGTWDPTQTVVRFTDVVGVLRATPGLATLTAVTMCVHGGSLATSDITLTGDAPLADVGTISGSVTAHT